MSYDDEATLNIGALSMATGVPVETIRTWERRYGFPASQRNDAGHRIYELDTIEHLRLITAILARGYRPSQLEGRTAEELEDLLEKTSRAEDSESESPSTKKSEEVCDKWLRCWMDAVSSLDREEFERRLRANFSRLNALEFLDGRLGPFLVELGEGWASGRLSVLHEHFASECIRDFLVDVWRPLSDMARGRRVVLTTFSGEQHCLGLHMAALVVAMAGCRVLFLGANTPVHDIAEAAEQTQSQAVTLSISQYANAQVVEKMLTQLRELLDPRVEILIGGSGAGESVEGARSLKSLEELLDYLSE